MRDLWLVFIFTAPLLTAAVCFTGMRILAWKYPADEAEAGEGGWATDLVRSVQFGLFFPLTWLIGLVLLGTVISRWRAKRAAQKASG